jgi:hypothetical protein
MGAPKTAMFSARATDLHYCRKHREVALEADWHTAWQVGADCGYERSWNLASNAVLVVLGRYDIQLEKRVGMDKLLP